MSPRGMGAKVATGRVDAARAGWGAGPIAAGDDTIAIRMSRRAHLMGASAMAGALRSMAIAAGMLTVFGGAPAAADCASTGAGFTGTCTATATGTGSTAVGAGANATATNASAYGASSNASDSNATAVGASSRASDGAGVLQQCERRQRDRDRLER